MPRRAALAEQTQDGWARPGAQARYRLKERAAFRALRLRLADQQRGGFPGALHVAGIAVEKND